MARNRMLTCQQQPYSQSRSSGSSYHLPSSSVERETSPPPRTAAADRPYCTSSSSEYPAPPPESPSALAPQGQTHPAPPPPSGLFAALIFDRGRVHQSISCTPAERIPSATRWFRSRHIVSPAYEGPKRDFDPGSRHIALDPSDDWGTEDMSSASHAKKESTPVVSKRRGRPPKKKNIAKAKGKAVVDRSKKRPAINDEDQAYIPSKKVKIEPRANISRKVGGNTLAQTKFASSVIDLTGSDNDDEVTLISHPRASASVLDMYEPETKPSAFGGVMQPWSFPERESPGRDSDLHPITSIYSPDNSEELRKARQELQDVQQKLQTTADTVERLQQEMEKKEADMQLERQLAKQEVNKLTRDFDTEKLRSRTLSKERDQAAHERNQLREQLRASVNEARQRADLATDLQDLQRRYDQEKEERKKEQQEHADALEDIVQSNAAGSKTRGSTLQDENSRLQNENSRLQNENSRLAQELSAAVEAAAASAASAQARTVSSPVPSSSSAFTDEERREDNVRTVYLITKKNYDILYGVANDLRTCTSQMDLSSFGEFGKCMKKLRKCLAAEEEPVVVRRKNNDD